MTNFYLILDAARMDEAMDIALVQNTDHRSLYRGKKGEPSVLPTVAPYLFTYPHSPAFKAFILEEGWGDSWGIFVETDVFFEALYKHLRRFLMVKTDEGEDLYFRFYDPRVLRLYLPTCDEFQLKDFFGPITAFYMEDEDPAMVVSFTLSKTALQVKQIIKDEFFHHPQRQLSAQRSVDRNSV